MTKFNKNEMFCAKCLTHETFFIGGGSWSQDFCPTCKDNDIIFYKKLTIEQKYIAREKFDKMWKEQRLNLSDGCCNSRSGWSDAQWKAYYKKKNVLRQRK